jgi:AcrR family transcriptional regulator
MQMIAREAGFTRSNLYRYFTTREEIFLTLFTADFEICVQQFMSAVYPGGTA